MIRARELARRVAGERGYTLPELLTTMVVLLIVLTGITALFVSGSNAQSDLTARFDAQTQLRMGLDKLRNDVHLACTLTGLTENVAGSTFAMTLPDPSAPGYPCPVDVSWCTKLESGTYSLYRAANSTCTGGVRYAQDLTSADVFTFLNAGSYVDGTGTLHTSTTSTVPAARLHLDMTFDANSRLAGGAYRVVDDIVYRNG